MIRVHLPNRRQLASLALAGVLAGLAAFPAAAEDTLSFKMSLENDKFSPAELKVPANKPFVLRLLNGEQQPVEFESADMKFEKVAPSYVEVTVHIRPLKPGRYLMFNDYREDVAKAYVVVQ